MVGEFAGADAGCGRCGESDAGESRAARAVQGRAARFDGRRHATGSTVASGGDGSAAGAECEGTAACDLFVESLPRGSKFHRSDIRSSGIGGFRGRRCEYSVRGDRGFARSYADGYGCDEGSEPEVAGAAGTSEYQERTTEGTEKNIEATEKAVAPFDFAQDESYRTPKAAFGREEPAGGPKPAALSGERFGAGS
jgi:hypothetical protein